MQAIVESTGCNSPRSLIRNISRANTGYVIVTVSLMSLNVPVLNKLFRDYFLYVPTYACANVVRFGQGIG